MLPLRLFSGGCSWCRSERQWLAGQGGRPLRGEQPASPPMPWAPGDFRSPSISPALKLAGFVAPGCIFRRSRLLAPPGLSIAPAPNEGTSFERGTFEFWGFQGRLRTGDSGIVPPRAANAVADRAEPDWKPRSVEEVASAPESSPRPSAPRVTPPGSHVDLSFASDDA
jgi:hypothetical protein